jgi:hypothetical protein
VPKRYIPNLNYRDVAAVSIYAMRAYVRRGYRIGMVTLEDLDEALQQEGDELKLQLPTVL